MEITERLDALEKDFASIKEKLDKLLSRTLLPPHLAGGVSQEDEFEALKLLLGSIQWPLAVDTSLIVDSDSEQDKQDRAEGILDMIVDVHLNELNFLDFGCGEGHAVNHALTQTPRIAVGYDITSSPRWEKWTKEKAVYTTDWEQVTKNAPYQVILLYDVIDHVVGDDNAVIEVLKKAKSVLAGDGKIFVRTHPWCSRHATHLYQKINKAFIHLIFTPEELIQLGYESIPTREVIHPIMAYNNFFQQAGLRHIRKEEITKAGVESFFSDVSVVANRIKKKYANSPDENLRNGNKFPTIQLEQQFLDYVLQ
jgi:2-polyprenyl-3-methyl-5-hydroxy-6-metoxy-1,4-benzoquinol methylase